MLTVAEPAAGLEPLFSDITPAMYIFCIYKERTIDTTVPYINFFFPPECSCDPVATLPRYWDADPGVGDLCYKVLRVVRGNPQQIYHLNLLKEQRGAVSVGTR